MLQNKLMDKSYNDKLAGLEISLRNGSNFTPNDSQLEIRDIRDMANKKIEKNHVIGEGERVAKANPF